MRWGRIKVKNAATKRKEDRMRERAGESERNQWSHENVNISTVKRKKTLIIRRRAFSAHIPITSTHWNRQFQYATTSVYNKKNCCICVSDGKHNMLVAFISLFAHINKCICFSLHNHTPMKIERNNRVFRMIVWAVARFTHTLRCSIRLLCLQIIIVYLYDRNTGAHAGGYGAAKWQDRYRERVSFKREHNSHSTSSSSSSIAYTICCMRMRAIPICMGAEKTENESE